MIQKKKTDSVSTPFFFKYQLIKTKTMTLFEKKEQIN